MKKGSRKRLLGDLRRNLTVLHLERKAIDGARSRIRHRKRPPEAVDVLEVCAGCAVSTRRAPSFGLKCGQPIDVLYGWDLLAKGEAENFLKYVDTVKPRLLVCEPPCTDWCSFNNTVNFRGREDELEARRDVQRRLMRTLVKACAMQLERGDHFVWVNP